jgi:hypothetical protein
MTRLVAAAAACALASTTAVAQTTSVPTYVLTTVDSVRPTPGTLFLVGVREGDGAPSEVKLRFSPTGGTSDDARLAALASCERMAMVMMSRPGEYKLEAWESSSVGQFTSSCRLSRLNP